MVKLVIRSLGNTSVYREGSSYQLSQLVCEDNSFLSFVEGITILDHDSKYVRFHLN